MNFKRNVFTSIHGMQELHLSNCLIIKKDKYFFVDR